MKLSKAQQKVMDNAKAEIDYARSHGFCDWWRNKHSWRRDIDEITDERVYEIIEEQHDDGYAVSLDSEIERYAMNQNGISYTCYASSTTLKKLEELGLIAILYDSNGERHGLDTIKVLNY